MFIHITPKFLQRSGGAVTCTLITIPELNIMFTQDDLVTKRPWPNKFYVVASLKGSRRALGGIILETAGPVHGLTCGYTWLWNSKVVHHNVRFVVSDKKHDAVSDNLVLWPHCPAGWNEACESPRFDEKPYQREYRKEEIAYEFDEYGFILARDEILHLPTFESGKLFNDVMVHEMRIPTREAVFRV